MVWTLVQNSGPNTGRWEEAIRIAQYLPVLEFRGLKRKTQTFHHRLINNLVLRCWGAKKERGYLSEALAIMYQLRQWRSCVFLMGYRSTQHTNSKGRTQLQVWSPVKDFFSHASVLHSATEERHVIPSFPALVFSSVYLVLLFRRRD